MIELLGILNVSEVVPAYGAHDDISWVLGVIRQPQVHAYQLVLANQVLGGGEAVEAFATDSVAADGYRFVSVDGAEVFRVDDVGIIGW